MQRDNGQCQCCSSTYKLQMHHDSYPDIPENDRLSNVVMLCALHHMNKHRITRCVHISEPIKRLIKVIKELTDEQSSILQI